MRSSRRHSSRRSQDRSTSTTKRSRFTPMECLEARSLFTASLSPVGELIAQTPADGDMFGSVVVTKGTLALVGNAAGSAALYDTATGQPLGYYSGPGNFGHALAFFGNNSFAISAPDDGAGGTVYIYQIPIDTDPDTGNDPDSSLDIEDLLGFAYDPDPDQDPDTEAPRQPQIGEVLAGYGSDLLITLNHKLDQVVDGDNIDYVDLGGAVLRVRNGAVEETIMNPGGGTADDAFGYDLATNGSQILISTLNDGSGQSAAYVYNGSPGGASLQYQLPWALAWQVTMSGDTIAITDADQDIVSLYSAATGDALGSYARPETTLMDFGTWGTGVTISGNTLLISEPVTLDESFNLLSRIFVYDLQTGTEITSALLTPTAQDGFLGAVMASLPDGKFLISEPASGGAPGRVFIYELTDDDGGGNGSAPPTAAAGDNINAVIDSQVAFSGSGSFGAAGAELVSYEWDFDNDGTFDATGVDVTNVFTATGTYTVVLKVTDIHGETDTDDLLVSVNLPAGPSANAGNDQTVVIDTPANLSAASDTGVTFEWDYNLADGLTFTDAAGANASPVFTATGTYTVTLRVTDAYGQYNTDTLTVTVILPPPPTASAGADQSAQTGQSVSLSGSSNTGVTFAWDFNYDGTFDTSATGLAASPSYVAAGTYTVAFRATDAYGQSTIDTAVITVTAPPPPSPITVVGPTMTVAGSASADTVSYGRNDLGQLMMTVNGTTYGPFTGTTKIVFNLGDGDDVLTGNKNIQIDLEIYGGAGNDTISGGGGNDIIVGGSGNDVIVAGSDRDVIIGSAGADLLSGKQGQDILIAGTTIFDSNPTALRAILAEWASGRTFYNRIDNLYNGSGTATRLNGSFFLRPDVTVFDDASADTLSGAGGKDWLIFNATGSGIRDVVTDLNGADEIMDVDPII